MRSLTQFEEGMFNFFEYFDKVNEDHYFVEKGKSIKDFAIIPTDTPIKDRAYVELNLRAERFYRIHRR